MTDISGLGKLLDFGADCIERQNIKILKLKGVKKLFFPMLVAAHNYTEGIFTLCKENRSPPSSALLRPLCENLINARFLFCNRRKHTHVIYLDSLLEKKKQLEHALRFLKQNPHRIAESNLSVKDVEKALKKVVTQEKKAKAKADRYSGHQILDTQGRAHHVDEYNASKHTKSSSLEWLYILLFRGLSPSTHIKFLDFRRYFKYEGSEILVYLSGNPEETGQIVMLAEYLYKELLGTFLKTFKSPLQYQFDNLYRTKNTRA